MAENKKFTRLINSDGTKQAVALDMISFDEQTKKLTLYSSVDDTIKEETTIPASEVDATLSQSGLAADAKATGDAVKDVVKVGGTASGFTGIIVGTGEEEIELVEQKDFDAEIAKLNAKVGTPLVANTASAMVDTTKIYVYTGNENGYVNGNWYFYNGTNWESGGVYNAVAVQTDRTLTQENMAADAKKTGDEISQLMSDLTSFENNICDASIGDNLCDLTKCIGNTFINVNGVLAELSGYMVSDFIPVENGETYFVVGYGPEAYPIRTRYIAQLYDADKNPISATQVNTDNVHGIAITVNSELAVYMRGCGHTFSYNNLQIEKSSSITYEKAYKETYANKMELPQIASLEPLEGLASRVVGTNLLPQTNRVSGYMSNRVGTINSGGYYTSDYIPVVAGQAYTYCVVNSSYNTRLIVLLYDADKNPMADTYVNNSSTMAIQFTPTKNGYVRVSATTGFFTTSAMIVKGTTIPETYEGYKEVYQLAENAMPKSENILSGKKWAVCGDSFTAYTNAKFTSGNYYGKDKTYPRLIAERNGMNLVENFFASGRTLAYPSDGTFHNSITDPDATCYYQNIPEDTDYITIMLGINDCHHSSGTSGSDGEDTTGIIPIGTINDTTTATYYGAWNVVLLWLMENRPFAHIGILVSNGCDYEEYRTAQIAIANKYGIPYIDLNGDARTPVMIRSINPSIATPVKTLVTRKQSVDFDGTITGSVNRHPNWQAHEYESYFIENFLRSI